jgi:hypothetical protein
VFHIHEDLAPDLIPWDDLPGATIDLPFDDAVLDAGIKFWVRGYVWCEPKLALQVIKLGQVCGCHRMVDAVARLLTKLVADNTVDEFLNGISDATSLTNAI